MESYLEMPNGNRLEGIKYYDIADAAMQIVEIKITEDEDLRMKFNEFKKDYKHYEPYLDFLIIYLGYKFIKPFCTEEGYLYGLNGELHYLMHPYDEIHKTDIIYPKSDDKSLGINSFSVDELDDSVISPDGLCYKLNRDNGDYHQMFYEVILMNKMISNKKIYEDYITCMKENSMVYYNINAYFRDRLGFLQVVKYPDNSGHIIYNAELKDGYVDGMLNGIKGMYPKIMLEENNIPSNMVEECNNMKAEMNNIYEGRRI